MTPNPERPDRIDLSSSDDPRDAAHRAVACLAQGGVVALPTETAPVLAASALAPKAVGRLSAGALDPSGLGLSVALRGAEEVADWVAGVSEVGRKFARRAWPGPVTILFPGQSERGLSGRLAPEVRRMLVGPDAMIGLRRPSHDVFREILDLVPGPLVLRDAEGDAIHSADPDMILQDGTRRPSGRNSVVRVEGDRWSIAVEGVVEARTLKRMVGTVVLFVCTGNTCRSPMAEALCRVLMAERLACTPDALEDRGYVIASAGLAASRGARAASDAAEVVLARGGSLRNHSSRQVGDAMIAGSDYIIAMTRDHRDALLDEYPEAEDRIRLLHPRGGDVADPIGCDRETYRRTAEAIEAHLKPLLDEIGL